MDIRCIVAGGRGFADYDKTCEALDHYFGEAYTRGDTVTIISGGAHGADHMGEMYAKDQGLDLETYPAQWDKYGKSAGYRRNEVMAKTATHLVAFWDGKSRGTKHMIDLATTHGLTVRVVRYAD